MTSCHADVGYPIEHYVKARARKAHAVSTDYRVCRGVGRIPVLSVEEETFDRRQIQRDVVNCRLALGCAG